MGKNINKIWSDKWKKEYKTTIKKGNTMLYPAETIIRIFKGNYIKEFPDKFDNLKILEVGCGDGNNLLFFKELGFEVYATETSKFLVDRLAEKFKLYNIKANFSVGFNDNL